MRDQGASSSQNTLQNPACAGGGAMLYGYWQVLPALQPFLAGAALPIFNIFYILKISALGFGGAFGRTLRLLPHQPRRRVTFLFLLFLAGPGTHAGSFVPSVCPLLALPPVPSSHLCSGSRWHPFGTVRGMLVWQRFNLHQIRGLCQSMPIGYNRYEILN